MEIIDKLFEIHESAEKLGNRGAIIVCRGLYLSGSPYLWSNFGERAFRFKSKSQALAIINDYNLDNAEVVTFD